MAKDDDEDLPDKDAAKGFYAKYEPKEILGRLVQMTFTIKLPHSSMSNRTKYIDEKSYSSQEPYNVQLQYHLMPLRNQLSKFLAIFRCSNIRIRSHIINK